MYNFRCLLTYIVDMQNLFLKKMFLVVFQIVDAALLRLYLHTLLGTSLQPEDNPISWSQGQTFKVNDSSWLQGTGVNIWRYNYRYAIFWGIVTICIVFCGCSVTNIYYYEVGIFLRLTHIRKYILCQDAVWNPIVWKWFKMSKCCHLTIKLQTVFWCLHHILQKKNICIRTN